MALVSFRKKLMGEKDPYRHPATSIERMTNLQAIIMVLIDKPLPAGAINQFLGLLRELLYSIATARSVDVAFGPEKYVEQAKGARHRLKISTEEFEN